MSIWLVIDKMWLNGWNTCFIFRRSLGQILAWRLAVLSDVLCAFPNSQQETTLQWTVAMFFHICFNSLFINQDSLQCEKLKVPLNKVRRIKQTYKEICDVFITVTHQYYQICEMNSLFLINIICMLIMPRFFCSLWTCFW